METSHIDISSNLSFSRNIFILKEQVERHQLESALEKLID